MAESICRSASDAEKKECVAGGRPIDPRYEASAIFNMAIEHRLMHAETLAYLLHQLPYGARSL